MPLGEPSPMPNTPSGTVKPKAPATPASPGGGTTIQPISGWTPQSSIPSQYGKYTTLIDANNASTEASRIATRNDLTSQLNFGSIANQYDRAKLGLDYGADRARLYNAQYRDTELADRERASQLEAARRTYIRAMSIADSGHALDQDRISQALGFNMFGASTDAATRGAATSKGYGVTRDNIAQNSLFDTRQSDLTHSAATWAAQNDWQTAQENDANRKAYIGSVAKDYGVTSAQMDQAFKLGSTRLGLDYGQLVQKLSNAMKSNDDQAKAAAAALTAQILMAAQNDTSIKLPPTVSSLLTPDPLTGKTTPGVQVSPDGKTVTHTVFGTYPG